jgi:5-carboxymethyl-2-hydroxymuconate isomerase
MPHFHIDYSPNVEGRLDMAALCRVIRDAAAETGVFPVAGIRVRATPCAHVVMADGNPDHGFIDLSVRLRGGRTLEARKAATAHIFAAMEAFCAPVMSTSSLMLSMEMRDIDPELSPKASSIRDHLPKEMR